MLPELAATTAITPLGSALCCPSPCKACTVVSDVVSSWYTRKARQGRPSAAGDARGVLDGKGLVRYFCSLPRAEHAQEYMPGVLLQHH